MAMKFDSYSITLMYNKSGSSNANPSFFIDWGTIGGLNKIYNFLFKFYQSLNP